jgi:hypothetical protein
MISENNRALIQRFYGGNLSRDDLTRLYRPTAVNISEDAYQEIIYSQQARDEENLRYAETVSFIADYPQKCLDVYSKILCEDWHHLHELIVDVFDEQRYAGGVDSLYIAAITRFKTREYDDYHALGMRCIYALREIGTEEALEKLRLLAKHDAPELAELATEYAEDLDRELNASKN